MNSPIDFYFDFSSPYSYLASTRIDVLAGELSRSVSWRPILLGPIFKQIGTTPLIEIPSKGAYMLRDLERTAQLFGISYVPPSPFPIATVKAARAMLWIEKNSGEVLARDFAHRIFHAYFAEKKNISELKIVLEILSQTGLDPMRAAHGIEQENIKGALKDQTAAAVARGVFGAPFMFIDDEPFWGFDHLGHLEKWIKLKETKAASVLLG